MVLCPVLNPLPDIIQSCRTIDMGPGVIIIIIIITTAAHFYNTNDAAGVTTRVLKLLSYSSC